MHSSAPCPFLVLLVLLLVLPPPPVAATEVAVASPQPPEVLERDLPAGIEALAISPDGSRLVYARPSDSKDGFSAVVWIESSEPSGTNAGGGDPTTITVPGMIRDLLFLEDNLTLLGLQYRSAKKREGDTFLFTWDRGPKIKRIMRVPPSSNDLDRWPGGNAILLACRHEIRTFLPPDFRSGPLFSFPGDNFAVTSLGSSSYVVVGQAEGLFLLDLSVPSGRKSMPVLYHRPVPAAVAALADYPDGDEVLVRLVDGRLFRASFDPPGLAQAGSADRIAGLVKAADGPVLPFATPAKPAERKIAVTADAEPKSTTANREDSTVEPVEVAAPEPPVAVHSPEIPQPEPAPVPEAPDATAVMAEPAPVHQIEGRIVGALELVEAVVLLGPDNILREAARVQPDQDGTWGVDGLEPGRYRIQLDGGGDRVLVAKPRFLMVDVGETPTRAPEIQAVRSF